MPPEENRWKSVWELSAIKMWYYFRFLLFCTGQALNSIHPMALTEPRTCHTTGMEKSGGRQWIVAMNGSWMIIMHGSQIRSACSWNPETLKPLKPQTQGPKPQISKNPKPQTLNLKLWETASTLLLCSCCHTFCLCLFPSFFHSLLRCQGSGAGVLCSQGWSLPDEEWAVGADFTQCWHLGLGVV